MYTDLALENAAIKEVLSSGAPGLDSAFSRSLA
jgi:hypothetical protein